jgi:pimeloyl-ACP methyl ester carboxylesterase
MPAITTPEGISIRYQEFGSGQPLVLAHGFGVSLDMWWPQFETLSQRLIVWDARGHGSSSAPADPAMYSMSALAGDLRHLLVALDAVEGAAVGGMSFGGQIALQYAVDHPEDTRALILSDSTTRGDSAPSGEVPYMIKGDHGLEGAYLAMDARPDLTPQLPSVRMPALVIYGDQDQVIGNGIHRVVDGLPERRVVLLRGCSHGSSAQRPDDWAQAVLRFLADVEAGTPVSGEETV